MFSPASERPWRLVGRFLPKQPVSRWAHPDETALHSAEKKCGIEPCNWSASHVPFRWVAAKESSTNLFPVPMQVLSASLSPYSNAAVILLLLVILSSCQCIEETIPGRNRGHQDNDATVFLS
jgi:hypothetical protein